MHTNIFPRTFSAGSPYIVVTSTSGKVRPMDSTVLKLLLYAIAQPLIATDTLPIQSWIGIARRASNNRQSSQRADEPATRQLIQKTSV
jgi:hypothetical protein